MFPKLNGRFGHYLLLLLTAAWLFLPRLGDPSLWDVDEGHNIETSRGMLESGDWVLPMFNGSLRVDKPALLYWLQIGAYRWFGVNEFSGRLPSALAAALTMLLTYELGRRMFGAPAGLLAGLVLGSSLLFCGVAHFANPDALLNACAVLTFLLCWRSLGRHAIPWPAVAGVTTGLGVLAKGPVGLILPLAAIGIFLLWTRQLRRLWRPSLFNALLLFLLVAGPWFALVGSETKGDFLRGFLMTHNVDRFNAPMEHHGGPFYYHVFSLVLGFLPWAAFLGPVIWDAMRQFRSGEAQTTSFPSSAWERTSRSSASRPIPAEKQSLATRFRSSGFFRLLKIWLAWALFFVLFFQVLMPSLTLLVGHYLSEKPAGILLNIIHLTAAFTPLLAYVRWGPSPGTDHSEEKFLIVWVYVYFVFFTMSRTKLPNYILPAVTPMALLTARFLDRWRRGVFQPGLWVMNLVLPFWTAAGVFLGLALLIAAGKVGLPFLRAHQFPGLEDGAWLGLLLIGGAGASWLCAWRQARAASLVCLAISGVAFVGGLASWGGVALDEHKATRPLVELAGACQSRREVHIGCYQWYEPSLVFYCRREVRRLNAEAEVAEHLQCPLPALLFVPATVWDNLEAKIDAPKRILARRWDFYRRCEVLVVGNR